MFILPAFVHVDLLEGREPGGDATNQMGYASVTQHGDLSHVFFFFFVSDFPD